MRLPRPSSPLARASRMARALLPALGLLAALSACTALPTTCGLTQVADLPLLAGDRQALVDIGINGHTAHMLLDTGAGHSVLTRAAAMRLGLRMKPGVITASQGVGGITRDFAVTVTGLRLGALALPDRQTDVVPTRLSAPGGATGPDGLLGMDILGMFDLDLDFARQHLTLYRGPACPDVPLPMPGPATVVETALTPQGHLVMRAALDGRPVLAMLDTGSQHSVVTARAAALSPEALAADPPVNLFGVGPGTAAARLHRFASITIGRETTPAPRLVVLDAAPSDYDMIVGMDYLSGRRLWISAASGKIFLRTAR
jgi:predicted aspartyl protease